MKFWIALLSLSLFTQNADFDVDAFFDAIASGELDPITADWSGVAAANEQDPEGTQASLRAMMAELRQPLRELGYEQGVPIPGGVIPCLMIGASAPVGLLSAESARSFENLLAQGQAWIAEADIRLRQEQADITSDLAIDDPRVEMLQRGVADQFWREFRIREVPAYTEANQELASFINMAVGFRFCQTDRSNTAYMQEYVAANGWPDESEMGELFTQYTWLILQHSNLETQEAMLPFVQDAAARGEAQPRHLATLTDRILRRNGELQVYGTQWGCRDGVFGPHDLIDPETVDARRAEVGLAPLEESFSDMPHPNCPVPD
jgi:hypothetical protein